MSGLIPLGTLGVRVGSGLPLVFLPGFPGRLTSPFEGLLSQGVQSQKPPRVVPNISKLCFIPVIYWTVYLGTRDSRK